MAVRCLSYFLAFLFSCEVGFSVTFAIHRSGVGEWPRTSRVPHCKCWTPCSPGFMSSPCFHVSPHMCWILVEKYLSLSGNSREWDSCISEPFISFSSASSVWPDGVAEYRGLCNFPLHLAFSLAFVQTPSLTLKAKWHPHICVLE